MTTVKFHPAAQREYQAAIGWYQQRNPVAARQFVAEVERVLTTVRMHPDRYGWYEHPFREAGLLRYPFSVVYLVEPLEDVLIVAVAHASREPGYWIGRV